MEGATERGYAPAKRFDDAEIQRALWELLRRRAVRYAKGESSSLPNERVNSLFTSLCFVLRAASRAKGFTPPDSLEPDVMESLFWQGERELEKKVKFGRELLRLAHAHGQRLKNEEYRYAIAEVESFFARYDILYFAADIPCMVDYPFSPPVDESLSGIDYILEYLRRLLKEREIEEYIPENAENIIFSDNARMDDEALRRLIAELGECRHLSDKLALAGRALHSLSDAFEVLSSAFWGDEATALLNTFSEGELLLLARAVKEKPAGWHSATGWENRLLKLQREKRGAISPKTPEA